MRVPQALFGFSRRRVRIPAVTVSGLVELACGCPRLHVSALPGVGVFSPDGHSHRGVHVLAVGAPVGDEGAVQGEMARVFPWLEEHEHTRDDPDEGNRGAESWFAIQDAMREIRAVRRGMLFQSIGVSTRYNDKPILPS